MNKQGSIHNEETTMRTRDTRARAWGSDGVTIELPQDNVPREVVLFDMAGKRVFSRLNVMSRLLGIGTTELSKGTY